MCLVTRQPVPKKAKEPIKCYKIVIKGGPPFNPIYYTAYRNYVLDNDVVNGKKIMSDDSKEECSERTKTMIGCKKNIGRGYLHTFANIYETIFFSKLICNAIIYECEIPRGSIYYEGYMANFWEASCYASKDLRFIKRYQFNKR